MTLHLNRRLATEIFVGMIGLLLVAGAGAATQSWFDAHFLPVFFLTRHQYVLGETLARIFVGVLGLALLLFVRPRAGRLVERRPARMLLTDIIGIALALILAVGVSELVLRHSFALAAAEGPATEEPLRMADANLGWVFVPSRVGHARIAGHDITYKIDAHGYRIDAPLDPARPVILFTGESIMAGFGLNWDESIAGQTDMLLKTQSADMAVFGYANDQAYLRLAAELPRFRKPVAIVSLFIPSLFVRNLDDDRPHLDANLAWQPGVHRWRVVALAKFLLPYHSQAAIERGINETRAVLLASAKLAQARGVRSLIIVPQFGPETPVETMLRRRILYGLDYVQVPLDPAWRIKGDLHPDAHAARLIAVAIAARLRP